MAHSLLTRRQARVLAERRDRLVEAAVGRVLEFEAGMVGADFPEHSFDTVVAAWVLCSVADPDRAAGAIFRWLTPAGRLVFLEHSLGVGARATLRKAASPLWSVAARGCRPDQEPVNTLRRAGFAVTDCERFTVPGGNRVLATWAQGVARPRPIVLDGVADQVGADEGVRP